MKTTFFFLLLPGISFGQTIKLEVEPSVTVASFVRGHYLQTGIDNRGFQGLLRLSHVNGTDTIDLFRSATRNGMLVNTARWYDTNGKLLREANYAPEAVWSEVKHEVIDGWLTLAGKPHGRDIRWSNGRNGYYLLSEEYYVDGKLDGTQHYYYEHGVEQESVTYVAGKKTGPYEERYSSGGVKFQGNYKDDAKTGEWKSWDYDEHLLRTDWYGTDFSPDSTWLYDEDGNVRERILARGNGITEHYEYTDGWLSVRYGMLHRQYRHGTCTRYYGNGARLSEVEYSRGTREGTARYWDANGLLREEYTYDNGLRNGLYTSWHPNGRLESKGMYANGEKTGAWEYYHSDGRRFRPSEIERIGEVFDIEEPILMLPEVEAPVEDAFLSVQVMPELLPKPGASLYMRTPAAEDDLRFLKRYETIETMALLTEGSSTAKYVVLTPMKATRKALIEAYLEREFTWRTLQVNGKNLDCRINLQLRIE